MTTSGTYSYTLNQATIVRTAMLNIGKLDAYDQIDATEYADVVVFLNMLVKQWQGHADGAPGLKTFTRRRAFLFQNGIGYKYALGPAGVGWTPAFVQTTVSSAVAGQPVVNVSSSANILAGDNFGFVNSNGDMYWGVVLTTGTGTVTLTANIPTGQAALTGGTAFDYTTVATQPVILEAAVLRDKTNTDTPLNIMNQQTYDFLPNKTDPTNSSDPTAIYIENQLTNSYLYTDCGAAQDVTKYMVLTYLEAAQDVINPADTTVYPQEWFLPLCLGLSKQICPMFKGSWTPLLENNYTDALAIARRKDPETSMMYFQAGSDV